jgi:hypothetical protein
MSRPQRMLGISGRQGAAVLEFALVAPALLLLILGVVYFGILVWVNASMQYAAEDAARCARVRTDICADATAIATYAQGRYFGIGHPVFEYAKVACGNRVTATINVGLAPPSCSPGLPCPGYLPQFLPGSFLGVGPDQLTRSACFP